jgi:hypothetical protein
MSLDVHSTTPDEPATYNYIGLRAGWGERTITIAAVSIGVLIVAVIAVLMGMA